MLSATAAALLDLRLDELDEHAQKEDAEGRHRITHHTLQAASLEMAALQAFKLSRLKISA